MRRISKVLLCIKSIAVIGILLMLLLVTTGIASAMDCGTGTLKPVCECGDTVVGDFTLTEDLKCPYGHGLIVGADDITIDGNGHKINGVDSGTCSGYIQRAGIYSPGYDGVEITNLEIENYCYGIHLQVDEYLGEGYNDYITIENCEVHDNGYQEVPGDPNVGSVATHGMKLHGVSYSTIKNNEVYNTKGSGTSCEGGGNGIFLRGVDGKGHVENNIIKENNLHHNTKAGFLTKMMAEYNTVSYNNVWENGQGGIVLRCMKSAYFTIEKNEVHDNYGTGIWIGGPANIIKVNTVTNNRDDGPYVEDTVGGHGCGIKICREPADDNELISNEVCGNDYKDIVVCPVGVTGTTGKDNKCDTTGKFNDEGHIFGCTYLCTGEQTCEDGTPYSKCSIHKPKYCADGTLINDCVKCSCLADLKCNASTGKCEGCQCSNGTPCGMCSLWEKPEYCADGTLIDNCVKCGCPEGLTCNPETGACEYITCEDGTPCGWCSRHPSAGGWGQPYWCRCGQDDPKNNELIPNCAQCGCPSDKPICKDDGTCREGRPCPDGTPHGHCVPDNQQKYCEDGTLIDNCEICGCPAEMECDEETGLCYGKTISTPTASDKTQGGESTTPSPTPAETKTETLTTSAEGNLSSQAEMETPTTEESSTTEETIVTTEIYARILPLEVPSNITTIARILPLEIQIPSLNITTDAQTLPIRELQLSNIITTSRLPPDNQIPLLNITTTARTLPIANQSLSPKITTTSRLPPDSQIPLSKITTTARTLPKGERGKKE
jgi:parallel beta-helix repeat protein